MHSPLLHINFDDYVALERKTLQCIKNSIEAKKLPLDESNMKRDINISQYHNAKGLFDFSTHWFIDSFGRNKKSCQILLGEIVRASNGKEIDSISSMLCMSDGIPGQMLRKIHFDYATAPEKKSHPVFHAQFAGNLSLYLKKMGFTDDHVVHLFPDIEEPRIIHYPMPLAYLFELVFREFYPFNIRCQKAGQVQKFREDGTWINHLKEVEGRILCPYFDSLSKTISSTTQKHTLFDFMYPRLT